MPQPEFQNPSLCPPKIESTLALTAASLVMAADISDEATLAPSRAKGIDNEPTVIHQCGEGGHTPRAGGTGREETGRGL